jgi:hypothetical protein
MTFGRGTRVKTKRPLMVSCPVKERVFRVIVGPGVTGTILEIIPNLRVRLDDVYEDKVQEIRWHSSARIGDDLVAIDEGERRLWVVK